MILLSKKGLLFSVMLLMPFFTLAQTAVNTNGSNLNAIPTAVPFLTISPDSRSGAMGDAGVALSPDANANYWNPSKLAFIENKDEVSLSYDPWLRNLVPDISLSYLSYAHKVDERNSIGLSLRYFNYGSIQSTGLQDQDQGTFTPNEFSIDGSFARKFGENLSLGLTLRYIHSNISKAFTSSSTQGSANAVAADVSMYYKTASGEDSQFAFGTDISNIGSKIQYSSGSPAEYLPTNLKIGGANTWNLDEMSSLTLTLDLNKLLVPSLANSDVSVPAGIFQSFSDVGAAEEFKEIYYSAGAEFLYDKMFALRTGYYFENQDTGGRHYLTLGVGFKYTDFGFDFSYLAASQQNSALANTLRFTLTANFGSTKQQ
ncbi:type IX secretion system outer membrane channel protein PorV [Mucilaginibacter sp.]